MIHAILLLTAALQTRPASPLKDVEALLDNFHKTASEAKLEPYFANFAKDGVFLGTDVRERWTVEEFRSYATPFFSKGKGWTYIPRSRHITFDKEGKLAWFDEVLDNPKYGTARGVGVVALEGTQWKIAQYQLTFPMPNEIAGQLTQLIKDHEAKPRPLPKASR
jgi:hypothetical protein